MDDNHLRKLLCLVGLSLSLCQCGGGGGDGGGDGKTGNGGEKKIELDSVRVVKSALFPMVTLPGEDVPVKLIELLRIKTWAEVFETVSEKPPVWTSEELPESSPDKDDYTAVRVALVIEKEENSVLFKVANDGSKAIPIEVWEGGEVATADSDQIAVGFAGRFAMKSDELADNPALLKLRLRATTSKNLAILKRLSLGARVLAVENGGLFPDGIDEIRKAGEVSDDLKVTNPKTNEEVDPLYFGGLGEASESSLIFLACPFTNPGDTRSVVFVDGSAANIPEDEYQAKAAKQKP